jgi:hypothetical protein
MKHVRKGAVSLSPERMNLGSIQGDGIVEFNKARADDDSHRVRGWKRLGGLIDAGPDCDDPPGLLLRTKCS